MKNTHQHPTKPPAMLRSIKDLNGYPIKANDGDIGKAKSFLFDDLHWNIRYLVADTGNWLTEHKVLISPEHIIPPAPKADDEHLPVDLTKKQIEDCPPLDHDAPVSRQYEREFAQYYNQPLYWQGPYVWSPVPEQVNDSLLGNGPDAKEVQERRDEHLREIENCHLRSTSETFNYAIKTMSDEFGYIDDFIVDTGNWTLRFLVISSRKWFPGRKFLIDVDWIKHFDWTNQSASLSLTKEQLETSPEYDPEEPVNQDYINNLYDFYGKSHPDSRAEVANR